MTSPMYLLTLPPELLLSIASYLERHDLNSVSKTCHRLHALLTFPLIDTIRSTGDATKLLYLAARKNDLTTITLALRMGASIGENVRSSIPSIRDHQPALSYATSYGYAKAVELLITHGANPAVMSPLEVKDALHRCIERNYTTIAKLLLLHGVGIRTTEARGGSLLYLAIKKCRVELVKMFLSYGVDVKDCQLPGLHMAARVGSLEIAQALVDAGADVNAWNYEHETPLQIAMEFGYSHVAEMLVKHGADRNLG